MRWINGQRHAMKPPGACGATPSDSFCRDRLPGSQQNPPLALTRPVERPYHSLLDPRSGLRQRSVATEDRHKAEASTPLEKAAAKTSPTLAAVAKRNIAAIAQLEQEFVRRCSLVDRISDGITKLSGHILFVFAHLAGYAGWILTNTGVIPGVRPFDPYPFGLLSLLVALEVFFLSTAVLMSQSRQGHQAEQRAHLDLQINLLAEQETTKILQMLQAICDHMGLDRVARDKELREMVAKTPVEALAGELEKARAA